MLDVMGGKAREHGCYAVVPLILAEESGGCSNAAVLLDRAGQVAGIYRKVHAVPDHSGRTLEGGVAPGRDFPVFECDFGRVAVQICYDMAFDEGWPVMARKGAELVIWPSQWPGRITPAARALRNGCYIMSSTWRNNASLIDPTGHVIREIRQDGVFVQQIDLSYVLLNWARTLLEGKAFDAAYGERAGYRYDAAEDMGIFWSNDPETPIADMVRTLGLETRPQELANSRKRQDEVRGGPPSLD